MDKSYFSLNNVIKVKNMNKAKSVVDFYILCNSLKDIVRSGWKSWNVKRERVESIAEHIFGFK